MMTFEMRETMVDINKGQLFLGVTQFASLILVILSAGCTAEDQDLALPQLQRARQSYVQAQQDKEIATTAPVILREAERSLRQAEQAKDQEEAKHLAYMAENKVEIARVETQRKKAEIQAQQLLDEYESMRSAIQTKTMQHFVLTLGDVLFDSNRADLNPGAWQRLGRLVAFLKEHPENSVLIEGYSDGLGSDSYNLELSQRRAQAVQRFLLQNGITPERIRARGYGEAYPVASDKTAAGRLQNRRVEIVISEERGLAAVAEGR